MRAALLLALLLVVGAPAAPAAADGGPWGWPLGGPPTVTRGFAPPASAYGAGHRGADLPGAAGAPVRASAAGRITYAGLLAGRGVVVVTHGSLRTTYEPVVATARVGQVVALGEVVGRLSAGHAGCPVEACLHWGLRRGEEYLDPVRLVVRGPLRLLPLTGAAGPGSARRGAVGGAAGTSGDRSGAVGGAGSLIEAQPGAVGGGASPGAGLLAAPGATGLSADRAAGVGGAAPGRRGPAPPAPRARRVDEPAWSLRAAEAPLGAAAVVALVLGIGLLARPRPLPPEPTSGGVAAPAAPVQDEPAGPPAALLDLDAARARRQAAS